MAEQQTPNFKWVKPDLGGDAATWGNVLNTTIDAIDSVVYANQAAGVPIGSLTMWAGPTASPPANWLICDGRTLDGSTDPYKTLFNIIGHAFNTALTGTQFALPNLTQKFPLGAGSVNVLGSAGGFLNQTLTVANLPSHAHTITDVAHNHGVNQWAHSHNIATGGHAHTISAQHSHGSNLVKSGAGTAGLTPGGAFPIAGAGNTDLASPGNTDAVGNLGGNTDTQTSTVSLNASGTGLTTTNSVGSGTPVTTVPPFVALNFIIRYM